MSTDKLATMGTFSLAPRSLDEALRLATEFARADMLPPHFKGKPGNILLAIYKANDLGIAIAEAFQHLYIIDGKVGMEAELMAAVVQRRKDVCDYFRMVESTETQAVYEAKRVDHPKPIVMRYTIQDASAAGLTNKGNWKAHPKSMLRARCISHLIKANFQDCLSGTYELNELREIAASKGREAEVPYLERSEPPPAPLPETGKRTTESIKERIAARMARAPEEDAQIEPPQQEEPPPPTEPPPEMEQIWPKPASKPVAAPQEPTPERTKATQIPFGKNKGKHLDEVSDSDLEWLYNAAQRDVAKQDPKWHAKNQAWEAAIGAEIDRRSVRSA